MAPIQSWSPPRTPTGSSWCCTWPTPRHKPSSRPAAEAGRNLFRREGEYWTISYEGAVVHLKDAKGLRHLARLLADPGRVPHRRRDRRAASHAERARLNATRAIRAAMANLARANPALGRHLAATIRTGRYCAYTPDPRAPLVWER